MGVTFKISKTGRKFRPRISTEAAAPDSPEQLNSKAKAIVESHAGEFAQPSLPDISPEHEVSFILSLYPNGYSLGKPSEAVQQTSFRDAPKALHPYNRAAESLLSAIEAGRLPRDILEDIPCKFVDGVIICEVQDYRKRTPEQASPVNVISQQLRSGALTPHQSAAVLTNLRLANRGGVMGAPQAGISGVTGARQMHPSSAGLSMMDQNTLNRANLQRAMGNMGPPKLMSGINHYMNQQQLQQQQPQQQQLQHQQQLQQPMSQPTQQLAQSQQQQQQQLQQHELPQQPQQQLATASPLQSVLSPPQVSSPSAGITQQQLQQSSPQQMSQRTPMSPQQMNQRTPMSPQISSGTMQHPP